MIHGKAPGPTGTTATMIKAWPTDIHEHVFQLLNDIWSSMKIPQWWFNGHLRPTPSTIFDHLVSMKSRAKYLLLLSLRESYANGKNFICIIPTNMPSVMVAALIKLFFSSLILLKTPVNVIFHYRESFGIFAVLSTPSHSTSPDSHCSVLVFPSRLLNSLSRLLKKLHMTVASAFHLANHNENINTP